MLAMFRNMGRGQHLLEQSECGEDGLGDREEKGF